MASSKCASVEPGKRFKAVRIFAMFSLAIKYFSMNDQTTAATTTGAIAIICVLADSSSMPRVTSHVKPPTKRFLVMLEIKAKREFLIISIALVNAAELHFKICVFLAQL